jgi:hypothetical protein
MYPGQEMWIAYHPTKPFACLSGNTRNKDGTWTGTMDSFKLDLSKHSDFNKIHSELIFEHYEKNKHKKYL